MSLRARSVNSFETETGYWRDAIVSFRGWTTRPTDITKNDFKHLLTYTQKVGLFNDLFTLK